MHPDLCCTACRYSCPSMRYKASSGILRPPLITLKNGNSSTHLRQPSGKGTAGEADPSTVLSSYAGTTSNTGGAKPLLQELSSTSTSSVGDGGSKTSSTTTGHNGDKLASHSTFQFPQSQAATAQHPSMSEADSKAQQNAPVAGCDEGEPHYTISHRGRVDLAAQAWGDAGRGLHLESGRPKVGDATAAWEPCSTLFTWV